MGVTQLLLEMRIVVGYLGEEEQYAWWKSSFFTPQSKAFLAPIFGRTQNLAQSVGATAAAAGVHDERIGIGKVYHLFRLPEDVEQALHRLLYQPSVQSKLVDLTAHRDRALQYLRAQAGTERSGSIGPTRIGSSRELLVAEPWSVAATHYLAAFEDGAEVFPYFADRE